jgi:hypothetical protein
MKRGLGPAKTRTDWYLTGIELLDIPKLAKSYERRRGS